MIDELERLLGEDEEETEMTFRLPVLRRGRADSRRQESAGAQETQLPGDDLAAEEPAGAPEGKKIRTAGFFPRLAGGKHSEKESEFSVRRQSADVAAQAASAGGRTAGQAVDPIGFQRTERAETLYRALMRARRAGAFRGSGSTDSARPLTREAAQPAGGGWDVLRLDRAFQRDARRYDGGFTWQ